MQNSKTISDSDAILLYRVGPVLCCSPTRDVESVVVAPAMVKPPGTNDLRPGVFKHVSGIVKIIDLRVAFGVDRSQNGAGRIIVVRLGDDHPGFWVDEIIDVIEMPAEGWNQLPVLIPRDIFEKTLLLDEDIQLYCEFDKLNACKKTGYLRDYIEILVKGEKNKNNDKEIQNKQQSHVEDSQVPSSELTAEKVELNKKSGLESARENTAQEQALLNLNADRVSDSELVSRDEWSSPNKIINKPPQLQAGEDTSSNIGHNEKNNIEKALTNTLAAEAVDQVTGPGKTKSIEQSVSSNKNDMHRKYLANSDRPSYQAVAQSGSKQAKYSDDDDSPWQLSVVVIGMALLLIAAVFYLLDDDPFDDEPSTVARVAPVDDISLVVLEDLVTLDTKTITGHDIVEVNNRSDEEIISGTDLEKTQLVWSTDDEIDTDTDTDTDPDNMLDEGAISIEKDDEGYVIVLDQSSASSEITVSNEMANQGGPKYEMEQQKLDLYNAENLKATDVKSLADSQLPSSVEGVSDAIIAETEITLAPTEQNDLELLLMSKDVTLSDLNTKSVIKKKAEKNNISRRQVIHIVVKGDTLWHIAKRYIHNPYRYPELARLSNIRNPDLIYPGDRVKIIIINKK